MTFLGIIKAIVKLKLSRFIFFAKIIYCLLFLLYANERCLLLKVNNYLIGIIGIINI